MQATLEEVVAADVLVHVVDASAPHAAAQRAAVLQVLRQLGVPVSFLQQRVLEVWNKADLLHPGTVVMSWSTCVMINIVSLQSKSMRWMLCCRAMHYQTPLHFRVLVCPSHRQVTRTVAHHPLMMMAVMRQLAV